ncbi:MAG TPA: lysylphosphatidylglycerol synthase transmembrane domain-containing protein [Gaiellaceae bacterium]|nr:lysylphosphatidylglycerol synthase transmembrane domain-containing protein [Gaiellaceae bacterium]
MSTEAVTLPPAPSRRQRLTKVFLRLVAIAIFLVVLDLLGVDVWGWIEDFWEQIKDIPKGYLVAALTFQTLQTLLAGVSYYGILKFAYPDEVTMWPILTAYAVGVAMNNFLPANIGTFVTLLMFVTIIPSCTVGGAIAAYLVQKIFFTVAGAFVYLYMFLSVPNAFDVSFGGNLKAYPFLTLGIVAGGAVLVTILGRIFWKKVQGLWEQAKEGGAILTEPKTYLKRSFLPAFLAWCSKLAVTGIFLAAFAIPVTFESIMWTVGSGSLANVASFTPGAVGVTQATNALALDTCCDVPRDVAIDYSTAQQLITSAWNQLVAVVMVVLVFGWTGGRQLVTTSYRDAKDQAADMKEQRKQKKAAKRDAKRQQKLSE